MCYDGNQWANSFIHDTNFYHYSALRKNDFYLYNLHFEVSGLQMRKAQPKRCHIQIHMI